MVKGKRKTYGKKLTSPKLDYDFNKNKKLNFEMAKSSEQSTKKCNKT